MDRYSAVTEMRFDARTDLVSCDDIVFWRETGWKEEDEDVEALDAGWSMVATDIEAAIIQLSNGECGRGRCIV
jgi:hypothetical protein